MSACVECKQPVTHPRVYGDVCSRECGLIREGYERGREDERRDVVAWLRDPKNEVAFAGYCSGKIEKGEHEVKR